MSKITASLVAALQIFGSTPQSPLSLENVQAPQKITQAGLSHSKTLPEKSVNTEIFLKINLYNPQFELVTKAITRIYEAHPEYSGDKLLNENRTLTAEKIKQSSGFFSKVMGFLPVLTAFIPGLNIIAAAALSSVISMGVGLASGQSFGKAILGAAISFGTSIVAAGVRGIADAVLAGGKNIGQAFTSALIKSAGGGLESGTIRLATNVVMSSVGEKLGPVGSSILGGVLGGITSGNPANTLTENIVMGAIKGTASGFISQTLGNSTGAQFASAAIGGITDAAIDKAGNYVISEYKKVQYNIAAEKALPKDALAYKNNDGYIQYGIVEKKDGTKDIYQYNDRTNKFENQYTNVKNGEVLGLGYLAGAKGVAFIPTLEAKGSVTHQNGITTYYDKQGNFIEGIPDNQIALRDASGKVMATKLPVSMLTMGMGKDILFTPLSSKEGKGELSGGQMMGYVPAGATPVIQNGQLLGSAMEDTDGARVYFNQSGETLYRLLPNAEFAINPRNERVQYQIDLDGARVYDLKGNQIQFIPNGASWTELNGNLASYRTTETPEGIITQEWFNNEGTKVPVEQIANLYQNLYDSSASKVVSAIQQGATLAKDYGQELWNAMTPPSLHEKLWDGAKNFGKGAIEGDFTQPKGISGVAGQIVGGFSPVADARDVVANALKMIQTGGKEGKLGFTFALIGSVPILGDGAKAIYKGIRGADAVAEGVQAVSKGLKEVDAVAETAQATKSFRTSRELIESIKNSKVVPAWRIAELKPAVNALREAGLPEREIREAIQSFEPGTIRVRTLVKDEYGLRFYGGGGKNASEYLAPTFPGGNGRELLAPYYKNTMSELKQWKIPEGTTVIEGRIAPKFGQPGGGTQIYVPKAKNVLKEVEQN